MVIAQVRQHRAIARGLGGAATGEGENPDPRAADMEKSSAHSQQVSSRQPASWPPNDLHNPQNWSYNRKWIYTFIVCLTNFVTS